MKILKRGCYYDTPPAPPERQWWVGQVTTCPICDAILEVQDGDSVIKAVQLGTQERLLEPGIPKDNPVVRVYLDCPEDHPGNANALSLRLNDL